MINIMRKLLVDIIERIDEGNSNITEEDEVKIISMLRKYTKKDVIMSKYLACEYLGISRSYFGALIREGKIPKGKKQAGFKELQWDKKDLDKYLKIKNTATVKPQ